MKDLGQAYVVVAVGLLTKKTARQRPRFTVKTFGPYSKDQANTKAKILRGTKQFSSVQMSRLELL